MIRYPLTCATYATKMAFIERALSLLQKEHNIMGDWFNNGITETRYQKLRAVVQTEWPYTTEKLSESEWTNYRKERFSRKGNVLLREKGRLKELLYDSTRFSPNLDDDITED